VAAGQLDTVRCSMGTMHDPELRRVLRPMTRSWAWVLLAGGGLLLYGLASVASSLWVAAAIQQRGAAYFLYLLSFPAGVLAILAGWHLTKIARALAAALDEEEKYDVAEFAHRFRLVFLLAGAMILVNLLVVISRLAGAAGMTP
jgi:cytochrome bd-type quinol oxidase subunit 1